VKYIFHSGLLSRYTTIGDKVQEISKKLRISKSIIKNHKTRIFSKRLELILRQRLYSLLVNKILF